MPRIAVLVVAAGQGVRAGGAIPKQYLPLAGTPMLRWTMMALAACPAITETRVVIGPEQDRLYDAAVRGLGLPPAIKGGATRQESVRNGLEALAASAPDFVLIHDAARPFVSAKMVDGVCDALKNGARAAVPLLPVADTLKRKDGVHWSTTPRDGLFRAQTPQGFAFADILKAHRDHAATDVTDDMALAELAGLSVVATPGDEMNLKVTTKEDFAMAERLLPAGETRTGMGYDVHRFCPGDHIWLCGLKVPHDHGLEGHSDADAGLHALTDAILGAIGSGDIGQHFPPTDERWKGAASWKFLAHAGSLVTDKGGAILHCDVTVICERPKVGPHREAMRAKIAEILALDISRVSVKATTTEGLGFTGRREGLAAQAIATVRLP
jgi:2-C-methyl-D-erythritol 4-phosphate cytidylyltransferase/2-C-methyl-D-erythritol 2,4-cyclodiphosphate synthase